VRRYGPLGLVLFVVLAVALGRMARTQMGIEGSADSLRSYVMGLGLVGPVVFVGIVTFRQFLLLPSALVLTAGGLVFGTLPGTVLGAAGIFFSGAIGFGASRWLGRDWIQRYLGARAEAFERHMERAGLAIVGLMTAHPMGVMTPVHWGAGLTRIPLLPFLLVIALTALVRAFAYGFLGAMLLEPGGRVYLAMGVLLLLALAPLAHGGLRRRLTGLRGPTA
jgi:uncharacterized membrane protein YdjX (TVP38/TMEM64 family)